jgi:ferrous iron transport protein A
MKETTLNDIECGHAARVVYVKGQGSVKKRILDMGMVPDVLVTVVRKAPLGDPIELNLKGYNLSLRQKEAETIVVHEQ